jgi:two-component system, NarL family, response regulator YdfI
MIHIHIVEESELGRAGLEELLRGPGIEILSSVASVAELEDRFAEDLSAGIVVAAGELAQLSATQEQLAASDLFHSLPVVLFIEVDEPSFDARAAIRMGARAVLSAEFSRGQILAALEAVSQGFVVTAPLANPVRSAAAPQGELPALLEPLTARKLEVLRLLALGLANKQIAARLNISDHTVKFHVTAILGKLGASSRTEAVAIGIRTGLVLL